MRDTPRTEVYVLDPLPQVVSADWARQLERELNAAKARVEELEAREKQAREDESWAKQNLAYVSMGEDGCWAGMYDRDASEERGLVERVHTIADALSALRDMVEGGAR